MGTQRTYDTPMLESRAGTTRRTGDQPTPNTGSEHRSVEVSLPRSRPACLAPAGDFVESNDAIMDGEIFRPNLQKSRGLTSASIKFVPSLLKNKEDFSTRRLSSHSI
jgi:hypothetical protein